MKYARIAVLCLSATAFCIQLRGQSDPVLVNISRPSPTVQAMQKFGDIPVSIYTGVPQVTVPVYTIRYKDITVPISLDYHAGGIKVSEEAGEEGLGWTLNAGGAISRNIIGDDDFDGSAYLTSTLPDIDSGLAPQGRVQSSCILAMVNQKYPQLPTLYYDTLTNEIGGDYPIDFQPDQYYYNILGKSGKFTIRHNGHVLLEKQEKLDISFAPGGASWEVKDEQGYIYDFTQFETYTPSSGTPSPHKSAWFLTQITSPAGNKVTFNYTPLPPNQTVPIGSTWEMKDVFQAPEFSGSVGFLPPSLGYKYGSTPSSTYSMLTLTSIDFTNGLIRFSYDGNRVDLSGDVKLDSISLYPKDKSGNVAAAPIRTTVLSYGYFLGEETGQIGTGYGSDNQPGPLTSRLKLDSVTTFGYYMGRRDTVKPYSFTYIESAPQLMPAKNALAKDHWGYFNGKYNNLSLIPSQVTISTTDPIQALLGAMGPERNTDTLYSKIFSLSRITYPTGGSTDFEMEANDYDLQLSEVNDHTVFSHVEAVIPQQSEVIYDNFHHSMDDDSVVDMSSEYLDVTTNTPPVLSMRVDVRLSSSGSTLYKLNNYGLIWFEFIDSAGRVALTEDLGDLGICDANDNTACLMDNDGIYTYTYTNIVLPPNKYTVRAYVSPIFDTTVQELFVNYNWYSQVANGLVTDSSQYSANYGFAGGLRTRRIIDHDAVNPANDHVKHYIYHYMADKGAGMQQYSFGRRMSRPQYFYFEWVYGGETITSGGSSTVISYVSEHLMRSSDSNNPLNGSAQGSVVGYDQVTVEDGDNGENGKSVYSYFNQPDEVYDIVFDDDLPHRPPANSAIPFQMNGSLLERTDYANAGGTFYKVKDVSNVYTSYPVQQDVLYGMELRTPLTDGTNLTPFTGCNRFELFYTALQSQWNYLIWHDEKVFNKPLDTVDFVDNFHQYYYDNPVHFLPTRDLTYTSAGDTVTTVTRYPLDYAPSATGDAFNNGIVRLDSAHVISMPVETYQRRSLAGGAGPFVGKGVLTSFLSNTPKPSQVYTLQLASPDYSYTAGSISGGTTTKDNNYVDLISFDQYDSNGNLLQQRKVNDLRHAYIYDYNNSLPVAEITNAATGDVAYTSFEFNGSGGWTIPGAARTAGGITGTQSYTVQTGAPITRSGLNSSTTYIVSYWSQNGSLQVNGTSGTAGTVVNGWTYYEHTVTAAATITVSGSGTTIDELRLFPKGSLMSTSTSDPLAGVTSQCSPTNYITYYGYDGLGRLAYVKDMRGNLIKTYNYHYK